MNVPTASGGPGRVCALTGAYGYVGSVIRRGLEAAGWKIVALSRRGIPDEDAISWSLERGTEIARELKSRGVSALVHAAWDLSLVRPKDLERVNVQGSRRLFEQARAANLEQIVFISTISAFAGVRSDYGRTKLAVERSAAASGGCVIRPGLVYGDGRDREPGGMFGALKRQTKQSSTIPLIGDGSYPQYLVHEGDLSAAVVEAVTRRERLQVPVTVAHPHPWPLRVLMQEIARSQGNAPRFVAVPWPLVYSSLRLAEALGLRLGFRSDSIISLVYQNPHPDWNAGLLGIEPRAFDPAAYLPAARERTT